MRARLRRLLDGGVVAAGLALASCHSGNGAADGGRDAEPGLRTEAPVRAPEGLILKAAVRDPDGAWGRLQHGVGGAFGLLPSSVGVLVDAFIAGDGPTPPGTDGHGTSFAAVVARSRGPSSAPALSPDRDPALAWAIAMPIADDGRSSDRQGPAPKPLPTSPAGPPVVWKTEAGWLVVASDADALEAVGPYVARGLPFDASLVPVPSAAPPGSTVPFGPTASLHAITPAAAMAGPVATFLSQRWAATRAWLLERARVEREEHGGRAPDVGDPQAIVATLDGVVQEGIAAVAGAGDVHIDADTGDDDLRLDLSYTRPNGPGEEADGGDALPLTELPADTPLALLVQGNALARARGATALVGSLGAMAGVDLGDAPNHAIQGWVGATGNWTTLALLDATAGASDGGSERAAGEGSSGLVVRAPLSGVGAQGEAQALAVVHDVLALSRLPPLRALLARAFHVAPAVFGSSGGAAIASFAPTPPARAAADRATVSWTAAAGRLAVAGGTDPVGLLRRMSASPSDDERTTRVLTSLGAGVGFAVLARPLRFGLTPRPSPLPPPSAPLVLAGGARAGVFWGTADIADELFTEGVRLSGGLF